ncbi:MAG: hypothetical protein AB1553_14900 [Nitrospirota bacterium]
MDQKKLMTRVKYKTDNERLNINSLVYSIADTAIFTVNNLVNQKGALMMAWLEGDTLHTKTLYEPATQATISKVLTMEDKDAKLIMLSDGMIVILSIKDPKGCTPQIVKQQTKA